MKKLRTCPVCNAYTMAEQHCGSAAVSAYPPKYSPADKYGAYRRKAKEESK